MTNRPRRKPKFIQLKKISSLLVAFTLTFAILMPVVVVVNCILWIQGRGRLRLVKVKREDWGNERPSR